MLFDGIVREILKVSHKLANILLFISSVKSTSKEMFD